MSEQTTEKYKPLFEPITLPNGVTLENRFTLNPVTTNSSSNEGYITEEDIQYAKRRSKSAPLHITTGVYLEDYAQLFEYGPSIRDDSFIYGLSKWAEAIKQSGSKAILQLAHAGRFAKVTLQDYGIVYGPSHMHLNTPYEHDVIEMSQRKIHHVVEQYAQATRRAIAAGFDGIEISNAQRLLPQQFFSPFSNEREDEYGPQSVENRSRFGVEIMEAVQKVIDEKGPEGFILGFRGTPEETRGGNVGYTVNEFNEYVDHLLEVSNIHYYAIASWGKNIYKNEVRIGEHEGEYVNKVVHDYFKDRVPTIATGGINSPDKALEALENADMVGASSVFVTEPDFVQKLENGQEERINLGLTVEELPDLAIPHRAFKDLVEFMDFGGSLPQETRDELRRLANQGNTSYFKEYK